MTRTRTHTRRRRGAILLVVITLLALFAVIGLSFALYADAKATASRLQRDAYSSVNDPTSGVEASLNPDKDFNDALGHILFGRPDNSAPNMAAGVTGGGTVSGFRGYEFNRLMYGNERRAGTFDVLPHLTPYAGVGPFAPGTAMGDEPMPVPGVTRAQVVNYAYLPGSGYIIDPEYSAYRTDPSQLVAFNGMAQAYQNVAAPYTYPTKDLNLAVLDPSSGKVMQPSFYRDYLFNAATGDVNLKLAPPTVVATNTDWTSPEGRLKIIRPRPADHVWDSGDGRGPVSDFPYPARNPDGSYTGDVRNFPGNQGQQRMDSLWVYPGLPVKTLNGKKYTALIAPMIIDLGGRVNLAVAGNRKDPGPDATPGTADDGHASNHGLGVWEVNPRWVFDPAAATQADLTVGPAPNPDSRTALQQLLSGGNFVSASGTFPVTGRYGSTVGTALPPADRLLTASSVRSNFNAGVVPPTYAAIDPDGVGVGIADRALPAGDQTSPWPLFQPTRYYEALTNADEFDAHPAQYSPEQYSRLAHNHGPFFPVDQRVLNAQFAGRLEPYSRSDAGRLLVQQLITGNPFTPPFNPQATPPNPQTSTTDPANLIRQLVTTFSANRNTGEVQLVTGPEPSPGAGFPTVRLGPLDLNRVLPDYRDSSDPVNQTPPTKMLGPDNVANWAVAQHARQRMARDIFVRLAGLHDAYAVQTGLTTRLINGTTVLYVSDPAQPDYGYLRFNKADAGYAAVHPVLRQLAQIAVNIVDYVDADDVTTTFTFNPTKAAPMDVLDPNFGTPIVGGTGGLNPGTADGGVEFGDHVVYGTETPRLVLNEVYATLTNNKADMAPNPATQPFEHRFWIELFNPMRPDTALSENGMARLQYPTGTFGLPVGFSPYSVAITYPPAGADTFTAPGNATGSPRHVTATTGGGAQVITNVLKFDYSPDATTTIDPAQQQPIDEATAYGPNMAPHTPSTPGSNLQAYVVQPHTTGDGMTRQNINGFSVLGPEEDFPGQTGGGDPAATLRLKGLQVPLANMGNSPADVTTYTTGAQGTVVVHLRRLANPYLPPNDPVEDIGPGDFVPPAPPPPFDPAQPVNPYITVDRTVNVQVNDNVAVTNDAAMPTHTPPVVVTDQTSKGRRHPFAAADLLNDPQTTVVAGSPKSSFFKHNDTAGPKLPTPEPFRWLVHLDRQLINPVELAHVSAYGAARRTELFALSPAPPQVEYNRHTIESYLLAGVPGGTTNPLTTELVFPTHAGFLRNALSLLGTSGLQSGVPVGGRTHGRININAVWHPAVLRAIFDRNDANYFRDNDVVGPAGSEIRGAWGRMTMPPVTTPTPPFLPGTRTPSYPGITQNDVPFRDKGDLVIRGYDPAATPAGKPLFHNQNPGDDTTLYPTDPPSGLTPELLTAIKDHTAVVAEPLKKMWNSTTTTSDTYLMIMTVGYFEVRHQDANGRVYLGKELYNQVPGDSRYKYMALIDRSQLALDPPTGTTFTQATSVPWQTKTVDDVLPGATQFRVVAEQTGANIFADGNADSLTGKTIRIGFGDGVAASPTFNGGEGESLTISTATADTTPGYVLVTVSTPATLYHPAGSPVTNFLIGNPGSQANFDPNDPRYRAVIPYFARLLPGQ